MTTANERLTDQVGMYYADPLGYVMFNFPWDDDPSIQQVTLPEKYRERFPNCKFGPDLWACEFLDELGEEIKDRNFDGMKSVPPIRFSTASGHGIGKSTLVAWLILFILDTRPYSKGVVTANTGEQLRTKTWAELAKWHSRGLTSHLWRYTSGRGALSIYRIGPPQLKDNWRCDAHTCRSENAESFQGLHAANSTPFYIFDEASGIGDEIWKARYGGATDGEPMSFDFGNPTRKSGHFFENCIGSNRHRYIVRSIDSRDVHLTNKPLIKEWADDWGEDSDLFKVKVRGVFPSSGNVQFIGTDLVDAARRRVLAEDRSQPLVIGVDVARYGENSTVLYPRIGHDAKSHPYEEYNGLDTVQVTEKVIDMIQRFRALGREIDGLYVDGGGLGGGVVDLLRRLGYNPIDVNFGGKPGDVKYYRRGDEMWGRLREALPYMAIANDSGLAAQLTQREYAFTTNGYRLQLETKKDMKDRGLLSPDIADALALTFAATPGRISSDQLFTRKTEQYQWDYDPLEGI